MRVVGYVRVSTERQADEGYGLDVQERDVTRWADTHGHDLVDTCRDEGLSGALPVHERPGLSCAYDALREGDADGLVIPRLDRLARTLHVQEAALGLFWHVGATVFTADHGEVLRDDPDDPYRTAMRQVTGVFSELERAMIGKRLRDGRAAKHRQGGYAYGAPPFGWRAEDGVLAPVDAEQSVIAVARKLRAEGLPLEAIAQRLTEGGFATRTGRGRWHASTVARILRPVDARGRRKGDDTADAA